ncbi:MAG TPA: NAD(P)-binding domain-containing protein [Xanthobacteraceae bacterium]
MKIDTDLLIIGAGPFGLSMAAYCSHWRLNYRSIGKPMEFWKSNMPKGMYLRSACDWHLDPVGIDTIESFLKTLGRKVAEVEPLSLEFYLRYVRWFQQRKEIEPIPLYVRSLDYAAQTACFHALLEDDSVVTTRNVVIAIGFEYFKHLPAELAHRIPSGRLAHTCDLVDFEPLRGKRCLIIGGRQSALEWAALIREAGAAAIHVCHRHDSPAFKTSDWSWVGPLVDKTTEDAAWFRKLPAARQEEIRQRLWAEGRLKVEPWLQPRILDDAVKLWPQSRVVTCVERPDGALAATLDNGETLIVDQVIAATGYKVDIARVPFLAAGNLLGQLTTRNGFPELDAQFQTSIPGLFMTSMPAVQDFGPFWGFTIAAPVSAQIIGRQLLARQEGNGARS